MNTEWIHTLARNAMELWQRKGTSILVGVGLSSMIGGGILAVAETPKAMKKIEEKKEDLNKAKLSLPETIASVWKFYILPVSLEAVGTGCILASHIKEERRIATLTAAATLSENMYKEYRAKAEELLGEKKEKQIRDEIDKDRVEKLNEDDILQAKPGSSKPGMMPILEALTNHLYYGTMEDVRKAELELNRIKLTEDGQISVNDYLTALGQEEVPGAIGVALGWYYSPYSKAEQDQFRIQYSSQIKNDIPVLVIYPRDPPSYDYFEREY